MMEMQASCGVAGATTNRLGFASGHQHRRKQNPSQTRVLTRQSSAESLEKPELKLERVVETKIKFSEMGKLQEENLHKSELKYK